MPSASGKPLIVISYAHADEPEHPPEGEAKWLSFVTGYLKPAIKHGAIDLWLDRLMPGGADWRPEIEQKLKACDIFILLVSRHSLSSDYVIDKEIPIIRERQAKGEAVHFYPLVLTPTPKAGLQLVRDKNLRPRDGKPLSDYPLHERYRHMSEAADEIAEIAAKMAERPRPLAQPAGSTGFNPLLSFVPFPALPVPALPNAERPPTEHEILKQWLRGRGWRASVALAERAALRVAPLVVPRGYDGKAGRGFDALAAAVFRNCALARLAYKHPAFSEKPARLEAFKAAVEAASAATDAAKAVADAWADSVFSIRWLRGNYGTAASVAELAVGAADTGARHAEMSAEATDRLAADSGSFAILIATLPVPVDARDGFRAQTRADQDTIAREDVAALADAPLWSRERPQWAVKAWAALRAELPKAQHWDVWIDWCEERLRGVPRGEAYDLVFASVPQTEWEKGPAAANAWIKARPPKTR
ncbi:MAG TPA: toll/interleukin-1 receptor domain-containing protein [Roseiarcus sp.]|jgi:hypothetical protein